MSESQGVRAGDLIKSVCKNAEKCGYDGCDGCVHFAPHDHNPSCETPCGEADCVTGSTCETIIMDVKPKYPELKREVLVERLAKLYAEDMVSAKWVARICDEALDRSGALLGEVRIKKSSMIKDLSSREAMLLIDIYQADTYGHCGERNDALVSRLSRLDYIREYVKSKWVVTNKGKDRVTKMLKGEDKS